MKFRQTHAVPVAAAKAGFSTATAYRLGSDPRLPSQKRLREDGDDPIRWPGLFDEDVVPLLQAAPGLRSVAIFEEICRRHPDLDEGIRRALERRVGAWRAVHGPEQEVIFRQVHEPGRQGLSDFTEMTDEEVTIAGTPLDHRLYHSG